MPLTAKQKRFCEEYIVDLNGTQAAIRAGYAHNSANEQAARMLAKDSIQSYIRELMDKRSSRTEITADRVLRELAAVAFAKIDDFLKVETITETEYVPVSDGRDDDDEDEEKAVTMKPVERKYKMVNIFETDSIEKEKLPAIASIKQTKEGIELKTHDKIKSLELLGKHLGMFSDKPEQGDNKTITVKII